MPYDATWNERASYFADSEWISTSAMREILAHMDSVKFALESNRQAALEFFAGYDRAAPFAHDVQFPQWVSYIRLDEGDWPVKIRQLITALQYKEPTRVRATPAQPPVRGAQPEQPEPDIKDQIPNDVLLSFTTALQSIRTQIGRGEGLYNRGKLERELRLTWA